MEIDWRRRAAVDIVKDLPENVKDARKILEFAGRVLDMLIADQKQDNVPQAEILPFRSSSSI